VYNGAVVVCTIFNEKQDQMSRDRPWEVETPPNECQEEKRDRAQLRHWVVEVVKGPGLTSWLRVEKGPG
jgi:hypothetical protein